MATGEVAVPSLMAQLKFFDYPWSINQASAFLTPPDLKARYALGLDYRGQPVREVFKDVNPNTALLPQNQWLAFNLLAKSPYELNLASTQRRDQWLSGANSLVADSATGFNLSLQQNDDAPFSPTDLEKVLRGWDADVGTLPSRLWDCVSAFDPLKLYDPNRPLAQQYGDPYRVESIARAAFNATGTAEMLAAAQQIAGINRRLVTTDSYDLPVAAAPLPEWVRESAANFLPNLTANPVTAAKPLPTTATAEDVFRLLTGVEFSKGKIVDLLTYRVQSQRLANFGMYSSTNMGGAFNTQVPAEQAMLGRIIGPLAFQELAPDVVAGTKMDLNRPFGDGKDNNGNGVVDDSLEAGDPFLDVDGNGKWSSGEPFIDTDGNKAYTPPLDTALWQGLVSEQMAFDYTNGRSEPVYGMNIAGGVKNLDSEGRQLYARQLYCLMLLLVDENYIAPWNDSDPQITAWMEKTAKAIETALTAAPYNLSAQQAKSQAEVIVKRKLTCRTIAQWAINCVDKRDSDVIMTPFEYDENPWDGWGMPDAKGNFIPLDGDSTTDENKGELIDWAEVPNGPNANSKKIKTLANADLPTVLNQTRGIVWGAERPELLITETLAFHDRQTENLISQDANGGHGETKKRSAGSTDPPGTKNYIDPDLDQGLRPKGSAYAEVYNPWPQQAQYPAELYSRLDGTTNYQYNPSLPAVGVDLTRLSNLAWDENNGGLTTAASDPTSGIRRSPVWRMIVVEEWPNAKNTGDKLPGNRTDLELPTDSTGRPLQEPKAYADVQKTLDGWRANWSTMPDAGPPPWVPTNPDFDLTFGSDMRQQVSATGDISQTYIVGQNIQRNTPKQKGGNHFYISYPYIEREWYFTTDKSDIRLNTESREWELDLTKNRAKFKLRIPNRSIKLGGLTSVGTIAETQRFVPWSLEHSKPNEPVISPILPGHYAVVGSAGTNYDVNPEATSGAAKPTPDPNKQTWTNTIGRQKTEGNTNQTDAFHEASLRKNSIRRIQMSPGVDLTNLNKLLNPTQQLLVGSNGGDPKDEVQYGTPPTYDPYAAEIGRDNEMISDQGTVKNIYDAKPGNDATITGKPTDRYYLPCVTIPIDGMNVSEPAWGYGPREEEAAAEENAIRKTKGLSANVDLKFRHTSDHKEGRYFRSLSATADSFDKPLDTAPELVRTGTTANYRVIHLQRLANPLLPWNPPRLMADGTTVNPEHRDNAPVNPYLTVDSASVNLTAFNGASDGEHDLDKPKEQLKTDPGNMVDINDYLDNYYADKQVWVFRSQERGFWSRMNVAASATGDPPQRVLWAQEPANVFLKNPKNSKVILDLVPGRQLTRRYLNEIPRSVKDNQSPLGEDNFINMVLDHSLGFGNQSFGLLYDKVGAKQPNVPVGTGPASSLRPTVSAIGAPAPCRYVYPRNVDPDGKVDDATTVSNTFPWLEWDNRPYVSANELLNVPAASQAEMLRAYATIDPSKAADKQANPYGLGSLGTAAVSDPKIRWAVMQAPFGNLMNMMAASATAAGYTTDPSSGALKMVYGAPNFYRILDYVQVPSRYVGTDTMLNAETFNDPVGNDIVTPNDPRYLFQPPFNKVSRQRDPGKVNLNTVTGRRQVVNGVPNIWSDVYDGIMHRSRDANPSPGVLAQPGPAWRDVVLSRRGYAQLNADNSSVDKPSTSPDVYEFGLNNAFPTMFANPFRSSDAGDLVPLPQMMQFGVDATFLRKHPYDRPRVSEVRQPWSSPMNFGDSRDAGFGASTLSVRGAGGIPSEDPKRDILPLFTEARNTVYSDTNRNPYMMYQPTTRLGNLVTDRSGVYAVWITVGYFEVEPAPSWSDPAVQARFGGDGSANSPATQAALAMYNRVYPEGYALGREVGSDTGDVKRPRGFYIIDRTEAVGFKPGEDLNVEKTIRLRRRIE
ncbi:MAG: hypothetical protein U0805_15975 [Pirellulales bacterium]